MTTDPAPAAAPLPQPPREGGEDPIQTHGSPQEAAEAAQTAPERKRITLSVARDLGSRARALQTRYVALVNALHEVGIDGSETNGLRGDLGAAFNALRDNAEAFDVAINNVTGVAEQLEEL